MVNNLDLFKDKRGNKTSLFFVKLPRPSRAEDKLPWLTNNGLEGSLLKYVT